MAGALTGAKPGILPVSSVLNFTEMCVNGQKGAH